MSDPRDEENLVLRTRLLLAELHRGSSRAAAEELIALIRRVIADEQRRADDDAHA